MDIEKILSEKEDWQKIALDDIKNDLFYMRENRFANETFKLGKLRETHIVVIYGKTQVGKTTLILSIIGIRDEYFTEVYETLRADRERGNSSTSTSIVYSRSPDEKYGCGISKADGVLLGDIDFYDSEGMKKRLNKIRGDVESGKADPNILLHIYIPNSFFEPDSPESISIVDLPGTDSRNDKETEHVEALVARYIPVASVCLIACRANNIQSLKTLRLPRDIDWKNMSHKFLIVITHSYAMESIENGHFGKPRASRALTFEEYVTKKYQDDIKDDKILSKNSKLEIYPIDIGNSFYQLLQSPKVDLAGRDELIKTRDNILKQLRQSIVAHKGEKLITALKDLKSMIGGYGKKKIEWYKGQIEECDARIADINRSISDNADLIEQLSVESDKLKCGISDLEKKREKLLYSFDKERFYNALYAAAKNDIKSDKKHLLTGKRGVPYIERDYKYPLVELLRDAVGSLVQNEVSNFKKLVEDEDVPVEEGQTESVSVLLGKVDNDVIKYREKIYPYKSGSTQWLEKYAVSLKDFYYILKDMTNTICDTFKDYVVRNYIKAISEEIYKMRESVRKEDAYIGTLRGKKRIFDENIEKENAKKADYQESIDKINSNKDSDTATIDRYREYSRNAYKKQYNGIVGRINSDTTAEEKVVLMMLLGMLEKDYEKVIGVIDD